MVFSVTCYTINGIKVPLNSMKQVYYASTVTILWSSSTNRFGPHDTVLKALTYVPLNSKMPNSKMKQQMLLHAMVPLKGPLLQSPHIYVAHTIPYRLVKPPVLTNLIDIIKNSQFFIQEEHMRLTVNNAHKFKYSKQWVNNNQINQKLTKHFWNFATTMDAQILQTLIFVYTCNTSKCAIRTNSIETLKAYIYSNPQSKRT